MRLHRALASAHKTYRRMWQYNEATRCFI